MSQPKSRCFPVAYLLPLVAGSALLGTLGCSAEETGKDDAATTAPFTDAELTAQKCQVGAPVTVYGAGAGASVATPNPAASLVPCYQELGFGSAEAALVVDSKGTITYAPIFTPEGVGLHRSNDHGATWSSIVPRFPDQGQHGRQQPTLFIDPDTDKIFFLTTTLGFTGEATSSSSAEAGYDMVRSTDGFATFEYSNVAVETSDWLKMYEGPPVTSSTSGYPNVLYMSAPSPISTGAAVYQAVYRSLDGGSTWAPVGGQQLSLKIADHPGCEATQWIIYGNGGAGPDGTVYISLHRCGKLAMAVSPDEGNTWSIIDVPGTALLPYVGLIPMVTRANALLTEPLSIDEEGTLYMVWPDEAGLLQLSLSKDKAQTWSAPVVVSDPAVKYAVYGGSAVKEPGTLAIAYYGSTVGHEGPFHGYVAESTNALDTAPTFHGVRVNPEDKPLSPEVFDVGYGRLFSGGELHEIVKPVYAPNGDIWVAFARDMCVGLGAEVTECNWDVAANTGSNYQGTVGRLVHR